MRKISDRVKLGAACVGMSFAGLYYVFGTLEKSIESVFTTEVTIVLGSIGAAALGAYYLTRKGTKICRR